MTIGNIVAIAGLVVALAAHVYSTIWWASKVNTTLQIVVKDVSDLVIELRAMKATYVTQKEFIRIVANNDKSHEGIWQKIEDIRDKIEALHD